MLLKNNINFIEDKYNPDEYYNYIKGMENLGEKSQRCYNCYKLRMEHAAKYAKENNYDFFTTTLSISPHKNAIWINEIGELLEKNMILNICTLILRKMMVIKNH